MTDTRRKFVSRFGEVQARLLEDAAESHKNGVHDIKGSDPFKWAICIVIGYECVKVPEFRVEHGFDFSFEEFKLWVKAEADLDSHDGGFDYLAAMCGVYDEYMATEGGANNGTS